MWPPGLSFAQYFPTEIDRLAMADVQKPKELDAFVERHLSRLAAG
jgi:hypothetical protein